MSIRRFAAAGLALSLTAPLFGAGASAAPAPDATVAKARTWLLTKQQADGGFEVAQYPGFETTDAALALAALAQTGSGWNAAEGKAAVEAVQNGSSKDALDALDDLAESSLTTSDPEDDPTNNLGAARAAKLIALIAVPLGIPASDFDPSGDSATAVDLTATLQAHKQVDGSYALGAYFNGVLYTPVALEALGEPVPSGLVAQIKAAQRSDGSWDYTGSPTAGDGLDIDTTAVALLALASAGLGTDDDAVNDGVAWLASQQQASGAWQAYGFDDPNSTSSAAMVLSALHIDVSVGAWRTTFGSPVSGTYKSPYAALRTMQAADGHIVNASETFGINTFATTQTMQALSRQLFLADEHELLVDGYSKALASPAAAPVAGPAAGLAIDTLGPNPSIKSARLAAATAVVNSPEGRQAAAADLFKQAFNRSLDPSGRAYWSNKLTTITRPEMLARLTGSSEYYRKAGGTVPKFVDAVYQSVLGRAADPSGRTFWINQLNKGRSVESVARTLVASSEYRRTQAKTVFQRVLDRQPTAGERDYWTTKLATTRVEVLLATLAASAEYYDVTIS